jgi:hypothetical protein
MLFRRATRLAPIAASTAWNDHTGKYVAFTQCDVTKRIRTDTYTHAHARKQNNMCMRASVDLRVCPTAAAEALQRVSMRASSGIVNQNCALMETGYVEFFHVGSDLRASVTESSSASVKTGDV